MDADEEARERARLLAEMRAYGGATPFKVITRPDDQRPRRRPNVYDEAAGEWLRSKFFKTILTITCLLAALLFCGPYLVTLGVGYAIWEMIRRAIGLIGGMP